FIPEQPGLCGYFSWGGDAVVIANGCGLPGGTTITHELGHYFYLPHTFSGWEGYDPNGTDEPWEVEFVDGSNCTEAGDNFCDTPADFVSDRWSCPYGFDRLDPNGDPFHPDSSLYMSYASDACTDRFSTEQIAAMLYTIVTYRTDLLNHPDPDFFDMYQTINSYPKNLQLNLPANYIVLKWKPVQGADGYSVMVTRFNGSKWNIDEITDSPYYVATNLQAGFKYRWKIKPFFYNNTCGDYSDLTYFFTTDEIELSPDVRITNVSDCAGGDDGSINIDSIAGGTAPYFYSWSNGKSTANNNGLTAGIYTLTITDSDTLVPLVSIVEYEITEPGIGMQIDTTQASSASAADGTATAEGLGTTDPVSYNWSTGATTSSIESLSAGMYHITITDGNNCSVSDSVEVTANTNTGGIFSINNYIKGLTVYPNPLKETTQLNIAMGSNETTIGIIQIYGFNGQLVYEVSKELHNGENRFSINLYDIHSGLYFLKLQTESTTYLQKFSFVK
ncbi:MAG: T9SS type A sorting domain-containing protein, partial [Bacteroidia bacterium]|nr:T9SS type A sorting domain-containing protein [Bacteroidia bacterium]